MRHLKGLKSHDLLLRPHFIPWLCRAQVVKISFSACHAPCFLPKLGAAVWVGSRYWRRGMADGLLEAVRGLRLAYPALGPKPLLAKG